MEQFQLTTPVTFIIFNRPDTTQKVFEQIRLAKPSKLYIVSDAPRNKEEQKKVEQTRRSVEEHIDWACEIHKNYAQENMGCKARVATGISWVLEQEEDTIILEDDCVPKQEFFRYCQEMLEYYRHNQNVMMVTGTNLMGSKEIAGDYTFSYFSVIWGWATWKRAWDLYDVEMPLWPEARKNKALLSIYGKISYRLFERDAEKVYHHQKDTWDIQWDFTRIYYHGLGIVPKGNLINNIGFNREDATHTTGQSFEDFRYGEIAFPMKMEKIVVRNEKYDKAYLKKYFGIRKIINFIKKKIYN